MGEVMQFTAEGRPLDRALEFIREYLDAPNDIDIELRIGFAEVDGSDKTEAAVIVDIGKTRHAFTAAHARIIASIAEDTNAFPNDADVIGLPNLILTLRAAADKADAQSPAPSKGGRIGDE